MADIFLSYGHIDNEDPEGWVKELEERLEKRLNSLFGKRDNRIYIDNEQDGTKILDDMMKSNIDDASIFLTVASPAYFQSEYCLYEIDYYMSKLDTEDCTPEEKEALRKKLLSRIVIVRKLDTEFTHDALTKQIYINFCDEEVNREFTNNYQPDQYISQVYELATILFNILKIAKEETNELKNPDDIEREAHEQKPKIFIAEPAPDKKVYAQKLESQLLIDGFDVIKLPPKQRLGDEWEEQTKEYIIGNDCQTVVHILGKKLQYQNDTSLQEIQYEAAKEERDNMEFNQIVWIPKGSDNGNKIQNQFYKKLRTEHSKVSSNGGNAELLESNFESFKNHLLKTLDGMDIQVEKEIAITISDVETNQEEEESLIDIYYLFPYKIQEQALALLQNIKNKFPQYRLRTVPNVSALKDSVHQSLLASSSAYLIFPGGNGDFLEKSANDIQSNWKKNFQGQEMMGDQFNYQNNVLILIYPIADPKITDLISFF
ncbi:MAG: toll/interleukin-1 receptor domain-containing protein [Saprospiraceae bacterium]